MLRYKSSYFFVLIFIAVYSFSCHEKKVGKEPKKAPPPIVDVMIAQQTDLTNVIEVTGTIISNQQVELHPEAAGRITYLNVPEGKFIEKGTLIARINDADLQAQLQKSKVQLDLAQKTVDRYKQLLAINGLNQSDYDAALNTAQGYAADINYEQALIDKTFLRAPFSGTVGLRQVSVGAYVLNTDIIATMQETGQLKIDFTVPENYGDVIKKGNVVDVEFNNGNLKKTKATITATEPQINLNTRNLLVRALLPKETPANVGAFAKVYVNASDNKKAIMVPTNAVIPQDISSQVILVKNGKAVFSDIQTGVTQANTVEITNGINPGDTVVVTGVLFAKAKNTVKIRSVKTLAQLSDSAIYKSQ